MDYSVQNTSSAGRPLEFDPEKAQEAMMRLFWAKGFLGVSLPDLQEHTGLSRSSLYNSFGGKQEVFAIVLDRYRKAVGEQMCRPLEQGQQGLSDVRAFFVSVARFFDGQKEANGCLLVNSMVEFGGADAAVAQQQAMHLQRLRAALGAALARAVTLQEIPAHGVEAKRDLLLSLLLGVSVAARADLGQAQVAALIKAVQSQITAWESGGGKAVQSKTRRQERKAPPKGKRPRGS